MKSKVVKVPGALLLDRQLTGSAKLLWMILQLEAHTTDTTMSPQVLEARSGLTLPTIRRGLAQLKAAGCAPGLCKGCAAIPRDLVSMPEDLLLDSQVSVGAKLVYGILQLTPGFGTGTGQFTYAELSGLTGLGHNTVKRAVRALQETGWLEVTQTHKYSPVRFVLCNPAAEQREGAVLAVRRRLEEAPFLGEALMREYLSLIVASDEFEDNATPGFLVNPFTGEEMQLDRYYPPRVAFEFNGPQHYGPTSRFSIEAESRKQRGRDYLKIGICATRGIRLVVVHPGDLSLTAMRQLVDGLLPLRNLLGHEHLIAYLESVSRAYRRKAQQTSFG